MREEADGECDKYESTGLSTVESKSVRWVWFGPARTTGSEEATAIGERKDQVKL